MASKISLLNSIKQNIKNGLSVSTLNGLSYVTNSKRNKFERVFWLLIIMIMIALATWQGLHVYSHYRERPVIVTVDKSYFDWEIIFPTLTVCLEDLRSQRELRQMIENLVRKYNLSEDILSSQYELFVEYLKDLAFKNYFNYDDYEPYATGKKKEFLKPNHYIEVLNEAVFLLTIDDDNSDRSLPINLPKESRRPIMRVFTEWGPCMVVNPNISIYYTPKYFNSTEFYLQYKPIKYVLNDMASMMIKTMSKNMHLYYHAPNEVMDIIDRKTTVPYNFYKVVRYETDIVITSEEAKLLSVQQKKCRLPYEPNEIPLKHSPVYSFNLCKFECRINIALKYCNCTPYYYRRLPHEPICNLTGLYCLSKHKAKLIYLTDTIDLCPICPQNCNVSLTREIDTLENNEFIQTILEMYITFPNKVYIRNLTFTKLDLTVQIGGVFGLFMGCSLLSLVEIFYTFTIRLFCGLRQDSKKINKHIKN